MIRILIADDHAVVRQGLKKILSEHSDMAVLGEAENGNDVLAQIRQKKWDIVILDITMPGKSGFDVLKDIRAERPTLPVLILSMLPEEQFAKRSIKAGASGYLTKGSAPEELVRAIRKIYDGGKYISPTLAEQLAGDLNIQTEKPAHEALSDREFQVLLKLAEGKSITAIAAELSLSAKTITTYRSRILQKMNMRSNAELTRYVIEHHLVD
ncbi:MAG: response regulator transcription factor [Deltaproteobacteria bacterium]|nr:response regulator transcription factor [Deltaproteobacteria bacterium]